MSGKIVTKLESWDVKRPVPYEQNMKVHDDEQISKLAEIIKEHGFDVPIVVDENDVILKGHGRILAAKKAGFKKVPVIVRTDLSEKDKIAMRIADNTIARGNLDEDALFGELEKLSLDGDFDFSSLALTDEEIISFSESLDLDGMLDSLGDDESDAANLGIDSDDEEKERQTPKDHDYVETFSVVVNCSDEDQQREVYEKMMEEGYECKIQTL